MEPTDPHSTPEPLRDADFAERAESLAKDHLSGVLLAEIDRLTRVQEAAGRTFREGVDALQGERDGAPRDRESQSRGLLEADRGLGSERVLPDLPSKLLSGMDRLPQTLVAELGPERYAGSPTEPEWVQALKFLRRRREAFRRLYHRLRSLPEPGPELHHVPFRAVVTGHLLRSAADLKRVASELESWKARWLDLQVDAQGIDRLTPDVLERHMDELHDRARHLEARVEEIARRWAADVRRDLARVGTAELSPRRFSSRRLEAAAVSFETSCRTLSDRWKAVERSLLTDLTAFQELAETEARMRGAGESIRARTVAFFDGECMPPLERVMGFYQDLLDTLNASRDAPDSLQATLHDILDRLERDPAIREGIEWTGSTPFTPLRTHIDTVLGNLLVELDQLTPTHEFAEKRSLDPAEPSVTVSPTQWADLIRRHVKANAVDPLGSGPLALEAFFTDLANRLNDTREIILTNVKAALEPGEDEIDPWQVATSGIERAIGQLRHLLESVQEKRDAYLANVDSKLPRVLESVRGLVLRREFDRLETRDTVMQVRERALDWKTRLLRWLAIAQTWVETASGATARWSAERYGRMRQWLGFSASKSLSAIQRMDVTVFLTETDQKMRSLPFIYRRLFNPDQLVDRRFFIQPEHDLLVQAWQGWQSGLENSVAIIGEKGSGKSTALHFFREQTLSQLGAREPVEVGRVLLDVTQTAPSELLSRLHDALGLDPGVPHEERALLDAIREREDRRVVIFDGLHNLFVRSLHGFDSLEMFWRIVSETRSKVFWVVSCTRYAWEFLQHMMQADRMVSHLVATDRLTSAQVQEAVLSRHRATGYDLVFEPDRSTRVSRAFRRRLGDPEREQEYVRDLFFRKLGEISEGNLSVAMILWIRSIRVEDGHTLTIQPFDLPDLDLMDLRDPGTPFTLAALAIHDALPTPCLQQVLAGVVDGVGNIMARLHAKGIVTRQKGEYRINMLIYRQLVRMLKGRNLLH